MNGLATRAWDSYDAYLFDIDGTLLNCTDAVHYFAFCDTLTMLAEKPVNLDGVVAHGNTDIGILRDALALADVCRTSDGGRACRRLRERMCRHVERHQDGFANRGTAACARGAAAIFTGAELCWVWPRETWKRIGRLKLSHGGLLGYFDFGGYSDLYEYRKDVFAAALESRHAPSRAARRTCASWAIRPADVQAAHANGLDVIAVCNSGIYTRQQLLADRPTLCIDSFADLFLQALRAVTR